MEINKNMRKKTLIFTLMILVLFISTSTVAGDANQTDIHSGFNKLNSECCSFIIQEQNGTVFAFRQDAPLNDHGVVIHNDTLGDLEIIKQEINTPGEHFIHAIITADGWVASHGGDSNNINDTLTIEQIASEMLTSKKISTDSLGKIQNIFKKYDYGHFLIKAPDGSYGIVFAENCLNGKLKSGEFLVIPNVNSGFSQGNYTDHGADPVDAIIDICSYEDSGWNRRNLYSYDYKLHNTSNEQKYGVDIYVTNDNGYNVGMDTSEIVTDCYFNNKYYPASEIPQNPDKLYIGSYIFEKQPMFSMFRLVDHLNNALTNTN